MVCFIFLSERQTTQPTVTFADIGGSDHVLEEVTNLLLHMICPEIYNQVGKSPPRGFLLHGPPGCGKTLLANAIAGELELPYIRVAATELVSGVSGESEEKIRELFGRCKDLAPCLLFIDEIDAVTPKRETASKDMERRIVSQLLVCMDELTEHSAATGSHVLVIGATNRPDSIDPALRRAGRFDREISLGIPNEKARESILKVLCRNLTLSDDIDYTYLARQTPGYVGADLMALVNQTGTVAVNRIFQNLKTKMAEEVNISEEGYRDKSLDEIVMMKHDQEKHPLQLTMSWLRKCRTQLSTEYLSKLSITVSDFKVALPNVQPSAKREGFATVPDVTWEDVGALDHIRDELSLSILAPVQHAEDFAAYGLSASAGVLLAGPPGCGKTLLAKAIANESGINFISVNGPELLNMYVGESERAVRQVFQRARNSAPCVIFFDEIDALCPRRSNGNINVSDRVVNQVLTEMDGLKARRHVFVMAATNRSDIIDPAILRPGRLDKTIYVGIPSPAGREAILKAITKDGAKPCVDKATTSLTKIAYDERCSGFTGADLAALVREASLASLRKRIQAKAVKDSVIPPCHITQKHVEVAFAKVKPSVSSKEREVYEKMSFTKEL
jgi:ribosome biogenesis ATPase